jgi:hypothetical protein
MIGWRPSTPRASRSATMRQAHDGDLTRRLASNRPPLAPLSFSNNNSSSLSLPHVVSPSLPSSSRHCRREQELQSRRRLTQPSQSHLREAAQGVTPPPCIVITVVPALRSINQAHSLAQSWQNSVEQHHHRLLLIW